MATPRWSLSRAKRKAQTLTVVSTLLSLLLVPIARAENGDKPLLLEVVINGRTTGQVSDFIERHGKLFALRRDLHSLGLVADSDKRDENALVAVAELPGVTIKVDGATQTLQVTASDAALKPAALVSDIHAPAVPVTSSTGGVLNYDLSENRTGDQNALRGLLDGRIFTPYGILATEYLEGIGTNGGGVRLDSSYSYSDPETLRRYMAGDMINGGLTWTRPVRLGGIQIDTNFGIRPDLVTSPTPQIAGTTAVPSTVDILVDDVHQFSREVAPGPFAVSQLPVVNGAGTVTLLMQNALGQQTSQTLPFYATSSLLAPGLASYSAEIGALRQDFGVRSDAYSTPVASATARYGAWRYLSVEAHGEATTRLGMLGSGLIANIANFAIFSAAGAGSDIGNLSGTLLSAGLERTAKRLTLSASIQEATKGFRDVAALGGDPVPRRRIRASASLNFGRFGSLGVAYTVLDQNPQAGIPGMSSLVNATAGTIEPNTVLSNAAPSSHTTLVSGTYTATITRNITAYATGFHDLAHGGSTGLVFGVTIPLGPRRSASVYASSAGGQRDVSEQISQGAPAVGDFGATLLNQNGSESRQFALGEYDASFARFNAGIDRTGSSTSLRAEAAGSVAVADGHAFAANTISDSFAVVDTGLPAVGVYTENRRVGSTDSSGRLLLPSLQAFAENHIGIDPAAVPLDSDLVSAIRTVRPQDRSGVVVKFALNKNNGAIIHLVDAHGGQIPLGSTASLQHGGAAEAIGYDGIAFIRNLQPHNSLLVTLPSGKTCHTAFDFHAKPGSVPDLGRLTCLPEHKR